MSPSQLRVPVDVGVPSPSVGGVDHADGIEVGVELLRHDRGQPGVDPLAISSWLEKTTTVAVVADAHVGVDRVAASAAVSGHRSPARGCGQRRGRSPPARVDAASWMAFRIRVVYVPRTRQRFPFIQP